MALGIYISVPFCKTKCSYCNFASGVFSKQVFKRYVDRVVEDIGKAEATAAQIRGRFEREVDSIYLGGGTPTLLEPAQLQRVFEAVRSHFKVSPAAEITVECAPGTLSPNVIETLRGHRFFVTRSRRFLNCRVCMAKWAGSPTSQPNGRTIAAGPLR